MRCSSSVIKFVEDDRCRVTKDASKLPVKASPWRIECDDSMSSSVHCRCCSFSLAGEEDGPRCGVPKDASKFPVKERPWRIKCDDSMSSSVRHRFSFFSSLAGE
jgi:hypothetical protein